MNIDKLSVKQAEVFKFCVDDNSILICDGAVRSGKTVSMIFAYIFWAMNTFDNTTFVICGKTVQSAEKNIILPLQNIEQDIYYYHYKRSDRCLYVTCGEITNRFYVYGGKDESSYSLIQGITAAGVFFDEVALMPKSFVDQATARTLTYKNAKLWFNCNPAEDTHWFYREWIENPKKGTKHIHFLMDDNPTIDEQALEKAKDMYKGVFYDRYISGLWCAAEGLIFPYLRTEAEDFIIDEPVSETFSKKIIGIDFGGEGSATVFTLTGYINGYEKIIALEEDVMDIKQQIGAKEICDRFIAFYFKCINKYGNIDLVLGDAASPTMINSLRRVAKENNLRSNNITKCRKTEVKDRPRTIDLLFNTGRLKISKNCPKLLNALGRLKWDEKKQGIPEDKNIDNINDIYDAFCYSWTLYQDCF